MEVLKDIKLNIPDNIGKDFLEKLMGGRLNPQLEKIIRDKKDECISVINPKAIFDRFEIENVDRDSVYFKSGKVFTGPNISKILKGSEIAVIFLLTLGSRVDEIIEETGKGGDTLATIVMDSITTSMLHIAGEHIGGIIKKKVLGDPPGWGATCTYSPGQYKWTIEEQKKIFEMVDGNLIGIKLNPSFLMVPFKSVSGVYGFGPLDRINKTRVACDLCPRENCIGRR